MRIFVHGNYEGKAFVLRTENGDIYQTIEPNTKFSISATDSYFARRLYYSRQPMIALIKLSGNMTSLSAEKLKRQTQHQKGFILKPSKGLWATTSGSARRGIWHVIQNGVDPLHTALWKKELSVKLVKLVDEIDVKVYDGGNLCEHSRVGAYDYYYAADGSIGELHKATYGKHCNNKSCQVKEASILVIGGTYCIQIIRRKENNGKVYPHLISILITERANKAEVAEIVSNLMK